MKPLVRLAVFIGLVCFLAGPARALDVSQSISQGMTEFVTGVAEQWKASPEAIATLKKLGIKEEELPLLFTIAEKAGVKPEEVAKTRTSGQGQTWNQVMQTHQVSPEVVYVPVQGRVGPPYGNAYGYFRNHQQKDWKNAKLTDQQAVGMANVKYLSERHQVPPEEVIRRKAASRGKSFASVDGEIKKNKERKAKAQGQGRPQANTPGNGKGQGGAATTDPKGKGQGGAATTDPKGKGQGGPAAHGQGGAANTHPKPKGQGGSGGAAAPAGNPKGQPAGNGKGGGPKK